MIDQLIFARDNAHKAPKVSNIHNANSTVRVWLDKHDHIQSGALGCEKGSVKYFLKVPLACLCSMAAAVQPNSLGNSWKTF